MTKTKRLSMAVIRVIRPSEGYFYDLFQKIKVTLFYITQKPAIYPIKPKRMSLVNLPITAKYLVDPISIFNNGVFTHRSWVNIDNLEEKLKDVDIVNITDTYYSYSGQVAKIAKKLNKKLVTVIWETLPNHPATFIWPYSESVKEVVAKTDLFILRSNTALKFTDSLKIPRSKVRVIYKGVNLNMFCPSKNKHKSEKLKILYVGQMEKSKGVDDLLKAFVLLSKKYSQIELILVGNGSLEKEIQNRSKFYPIRYHKFIAYKKIPEYYRSSDIFCSPSKDIKHFGIKFIEERFCYTLMEAQACGLPIVATNCGASAEEVGEKNLIAEQANVESLTCELEKLIINKQLRKNLGSDNAKRAKKLFDVRKQAALTEGAIISLF